MRWIISTKAEELVLIQMLIKQVRIKIGLWYDD